MIYLIILYILFSIFLIIKNYRNRNTIWFIVMLIGFCLATFGLAFYSTYINYSCMLENKLFKEIDTYIWLFNYHLKLDIFEQYRIMNIGTAVYIYGAICFSLANMSTIKKRYFVLLTIVPLLLIIIYDPITLGKIYNIDKYNLYEISIHNTEEVMTVINLIFNLLIKSYLFLTIIIMLYSYIKTPSIINRKYKYIIIGTIPINVLFFVLFFGFPNHIIIFKRYEQLSLYSYYNSFLYQSISYICFISVILLVYAMLKYNIFEMNIRKTQIDFENQVETAHFGLRIFSHSIKNQLITVKLLVNQLSQVQEQEAKETLIRQVQNVCDDSINRLNSLSRKIGKISLAYERVPINKILQKIISKYQKVYKYIQFNQTNQSQLDLYIDKDQFRKVIENLLVNAVEACKNTDNPKISFCIDEKNNYGIIKIVDNGHGINKKDIKKIFRPFYSTKPTVSNWGVGLAFCQKVIDAFGGVIHIDSVEGNGTNVEIYIPNVRRI